ncbi:MAG: MG2 domain-containing protein, partial [Bacteroidales bacterium]|nr:MG2 domain-containing protein [Bacteroidales bacterium]
MKKILCITLLIFASASMFAQKNYTREWAQVDSLFNLRQPQSAEKIIDQIYLEAQAQNNPAQLVKAHLYRLSSLGLWAEERWVQQIVQTEESIQKNLFPVKNILHSVAADLYWSYYRQNQWRFHNRTATETPTDDIRTWDLQRIVEKCMAHYAASLEEAKMLQETTMESLREMVDKQSGSQKYRPTLYDFLAFRAIEFYNQNMVQSVAMPNAASFTSTALTLLQQVIDFHANDNDPTALIDANLHRIDFVYKNSVDPQKDSAYLDALYTLDERFANHPASTEILFRIAGTYNRQMKKREAMEVIEKATARFPDSFGSKNCLALRDEIKQPELRLTADEATLPNKPFLLSVRYKNIPLLYYKIVPIDFKKAMEERDIIDFYANINPMHTSQWALPNSDDYLAHTIEMALPPLKEGYWAILASTTPDFSKESFVAEKTIWVSNLSYVRQNVLGNSAALLVLHRETGKPVRGVSVQEYYREYNSGKRQHEVKFGKTYHSDTHGLVRLPANDNYRSVSLFLTNGKDQYASGENISLYASHTQEQSYTTTTLFSDRAIYRPGQTIYFKGIVLRWKERQAEIVTNSKQTVSLYNVNGEKVSELSVTTNEFGSFLGNFVIPSAGLTGQMSLRVGPANGYHSFNVEEYKRPKFEVKFEPQSDTYRLGQEMTVTGKAMTYAGSAVSEANVSYRVVKQARFPLWRWWWGPTPSSAPQEIVSGKTETLSDGSFHISFIAAPDPHIAKKESPVFHYTVYATVSDINGETHEVNTVIPVGYQSLMITADIPEKVNADQKREVTITATNLNGVAQEARGTLTIWKLRDPGRVLQERRWERPDQFSMTREEFVNMFPHSVYDDEDQAANWEKEREVYQISFDTGISESYPLIHIHQWDAGKYLAELTTEDAFGETVENSSLFTLFSTKQKSVPASEPFWFHVLHPTAKPSETVSILIGSAYPHVEVFYEVMPKDQKPQRKSITINNEIKTIHIPVTEKECGNFGIQLFFVKNNRSYGASQVIQVPYDNKRLNMEFATFRDKLQPGEEEEWRMTIKDNVGNAVAAELLASMYDASLDAFVPHGWSFFPWQTNYTAPAWRTDAAFRSRQGALLASRYERAPYSTRVYDRLINTYTSEFRDDMVLYAAAPTAALGATRSREVNASMAVMEESVAYSNGTEQHTDLDEQPAASTSVPVPLRANFNETAFFYPRLRTNEKGETVIRFTVPESLTRWKMQGLAWTTDLKVGAMTKELMTQKELMIFTNPPRFFRENDTLFFSAKVSNISDKSLDIKTEIQFFDALTMQPITDKLLLENDTKSVRLDSGDNLAVSWRMQIPKGLQAITYRITAVSDSFSDGEESAIPVLTNRMLVTESLPLPVRAHQSKSFEFTKLLKNQSNTLTNHAFTIEFTSNPAWSAVQALPYLMEYPYECVEQVFSRYYANSVATHIANSDPRIKQVFDIWRNYQPDALQSNLEKNQELKALLLEETPWVRAAQNESERKQRIALLFDLNRMADEMATALRKIEQAQLSNGGFAWFKGGPDDRYMTQHMVSGLGRMQKMGISIQAANNMLHSAISYMDARLIEDFEALKKDAAKRNADYTKEDHLGLLAMHYLYARSFFMHSHPVPQGEAFDFYKSQATLYWTKQNNYLKGMLALALHRYGHPRAATQIMQSLTQTALHSDEMGMYWSNNVSSWWWYQAPVETQALMIEAYNEILDDQKSVEELKIWLLKQKQTQDWKTTKATSEAVYALLLTGSNLLASDTLCQVTVGGQTIDPNKLEGGNRPEAGTGYFKTSWRGGEIRPEMGEIGVTNPNPVVAWGAAYWQYFEQLDKITL